VNKSEIAAVLTDIGTLLELKGENPFKIRAYQSGARLIEGLSEEEIARRAGEGTLEEVKGIGEALAQKITELHTTGKLEFYEKLKASIPAGLVEILQIPGVGPKKIRALQEKLGIDSVAKLQQACLDGKIAGLDGFGEKTQEKILEGIRNREKYGRRHLWLEAWEVAEPLLAGLRMLPQVERAEHAGSLRRRMETVGDLDFLVATTEPKPVAEWFVRYAGVKEVTAHGETKASVRLESGIQADLRLVPPEQFVFALHHFTGSKDHNVQMRQRALARGLSMSEWGLFPAGQKHGPTGEQGAWSAERGAGDNPPSDEPQPKSKRLTAKSSGSSLPAPGSPLTTEEQLFKKLGLHFIPPELREGLGEIEVAEKGELPRLVEEGDIRGVFHNHTTASDGHNTLEEMTAAAQALGFEYLGIADHSKSSVQARGLTEARLAEQVAEIKKLNASGKFKTYVFTGTECDILSDGRLDFADLVLAELDYVVVSVHSSFKQSREDMTKRIIRAIENPHATMLGHLTGRLLLEREGYEVDAEKIIDAAIANRVIIELNASPWRLDMDWRHWRKAAERGLLCAINPDAHGTRGLAHFRTGVGAARKGWLTKEHVLTTRPLTAVKKWLGERKGA
jgi:DNA polymerase (family 10)